MKKAPVIAAVLFLFISASISANDAVTRALFTTAVKDREPVDEIGQLDNTVLRMFFFTEITGMTGQTITHRWQHEGEIKTTKKFKVSGNRWRVWSSNKMLPQWVGIWTVTVLDAKGNILAEEDMVYIPADATGQPTDQTLQANPE